MTRDISAEGVRFIASYEGYSRHAYGDRGHGQGVLTIGYGHTGSDTRSLDPLSQPDAIRLLHRDLREFTAAVTRAERRYGLRLTRHEFDSLVSFAFNLGRGAVLGAPGFETMTRALKSKRRKSIAAAMPLYSNPSEPAVHAGLLRRRNAEAKMFLAPLSHADNLRLELEHLIRTARKHGYTRTRRLRIKAIRRALA